MDKQTKKYILIGGGVALLYFILKPGTTSTTPTSNVLKPTTTPATTTSTLTGLLSGSTSLINGISNLFNGSSTSNQPTITAPQAVTIAPLPANLTASQDLTAPTDNSMDNTSDYSNWTDTFNYS